MGLLKLKALPAIAGGVGMAAIAVGIFGLAGKWWGVLATGFMLVAWAVLTVADRPQGGGE